MSSLALGFLRSRLQPESRRSFAETFHARSFFFRLPYHARQSANSSDWIGAVLV